MRRMSGRSRDPLVRDLVAALDVGRVQVGDGARRLYSRDASVIRGGRAGVVCFPETTEEVSAAVVAALDHGRDFVARGAGTGLAGGAVPCDEPVVVVLTRMDRILEVDVARRLAWVEPGVVNLDLTRHLAGSGLHFAPDPSSQQACTIGGNVAENSGGPHTLKYGTTTNHVLALELVQSDGERLRLGSRAGRSREFDLVGVGF